MRRLASGSRTRGRRAGLVAVLLLFLLPAAACELGIENPNNPTEEETLSDPNGLVALAVGVQGIYATNVDEFVTAPALVTDEWGTGTRSLPSFRTLFLTGPENEVDRSFAVVEDPWAAGYRVVRGANDLIQQVPDSRLPAGLQAGILSVARLFKAMAFGTLIEQYEQIPLDIEQDAPEFRSREAVLSEVLSLLQGARSDLEGADLGLTRRRVLGEGLDLPNTINAMLARYNLIAGNMEAAVAAANRVEPDALSELTYTSTSRNPIQVLQFRAEQVKALHSWTQEAEAGDGRVAYWVDEDAQPQEGNPADSLLVPLERYESPTASFPLYLPDEMNLIRAEAFTRMGDFAGAREEINAVRSEESSPVDEPVADLDPLPVDSLDTEQELLEQIAHERRYELYSQGLRWGDARRLGEGVTTETTLDFLPIPEQECVANPNSPCP